MLPGKRHDLLDFGRCGVFRKDPTYSRTLRMNLKHNARCLFAVHVEKLLQNQYDEFHRGEVVIQKQHFVERGGLGVRPLRFEYGIALFIGGHASHSNPVGPECNMSGVALEMGMFGRFATAWTSFSSFTRGRPSA